MTDRLLSLAAGTILDVSPVEAVAVASLAGWPAVGIWFDPERWTDDTTRDVHAVLDSTGLVALDIEPIILAPDGPVVTDDARRLIAAGIEIGARNVLVASRDPDQGRVTDTLSQLCAGVEGTDMRIVLEFLPIMAVRTLADAVSIVNEVDHPAAGVLIDVLHLVRSGGSVGDVAEVDPALLSYMQLCDVQPDPPDAFAGLLDEALHGRLLPGDGVAPLTELLAALPDDCPVSLELRSRALMTEFPDPVERARAVLDAAGRIFPTFA